MTQPLFPSTIGTQSRSAKFLTMKTVVRKPHKNDGLTQTHVLCGCTTFGNESKLGTKLIKGMAITKGGGKHAGFLCRLLGS